METEPTIEGLQALLEELNFTGLLEHLNGRSFERWKRRTEEQWKEELMAVQGNASGFSDIYNYLHQRSKGTMFYL